MVIADGYYEWKTVGTLKQPHRITMKTRGAATRDVFIIPRERVKNGEERLVVLNRIAKSVVERRRGESSRRSAAST